jgi:hypothetical protein
MKARYIDNTIVSKGATAAGWLFGEPVLRAGGVSTVAWCKENSVSQWQKGGGWTANLYAGINSGDDWAGVFIPVNELPITQFTAAQWSYYMTNAESAGVNIVVWIHDPTDFSKRAEVTQVGGSVAKASGWNTQAFTIATTGMFFYGENTTGTALVAGTQYAWSQFQTDALFKNWVIYRISLEYGWEGSGTLDDAWLAEVSLDGMYIPLHPQVGERAGGETKQVYLATASPSSTVATIITPAATKRARIHSIFMNTASATASQFEVYFHTGANITTTPSKAIAACTLDTDTQAFETVQFGSTDGPLGAIGEVVSIRAATDITTNGNFTIVYHEE